MRGGGREEGGESLEYYKALRGNQVNLILIQPKFSDPSRCNSDWSLKFTNILIPSSLDTVYSWHQTEVRIVHRCRTLDQVIYYDWLLIRKHL